MSLNVTLETALHFWEHLNNAVSLGLAIKLRYGDLVAVMTTSVSPENFIDPILFRESQAAVSFLSKLDLKVSSKQLEKAIASIFGSDAPTISQFTDDDRKSAAMKSWLEGEASCYRANERLSPFVISPLSDEMPAKFLRRVRRRLISWLGPKPSDDELKTRARHGPGSTFLSGVRNPTAADKYDDIMSLTSRASVHLLNLAGTKWMQIASSKPPGSQFEFLRGNRFAMVPKNSKTFRNIAIEGSVNIYFQLALGGAIRSRLRRSTGWDLDNAASIHRKMAETASIDGSFATLDLSNASDTLCLNLVRVLLSDTQWLSLLEDLRSPMTKIEGRWHLLEKFSSMGNGYTFELETVIFAALAAESMALKGHDPVLGWNLFVFGDDIIVPTDCVELLAKVLTFCGFSLNSSKSFWTGPFRESCGADYFDGVPVRGFYLRDMLRKNQLQTIFTIHNGVRKALGESRSRDFLERFIVPLIPPLYQLGGPERLGDSVLHGRRVKHRWEKGIRWARVVRFVDPILIRWSHFSEEARLACRLTGYGETFGINTRGARHNLTVSWVSDS